MYFDRTSVSAKAIARFFVGKNRIRANGNFRPRIGDLIINWGFKGAVTAFNVNSANVLNKPSSIENASNKIKTFELLNKHGVKTLTHYTSIDDVLNYAEVEEDDNTFVKKIYCRTLISSHSGKGIVIANSREELVEAPLYTEAFKNDTEFRVHVFKGRVIDIQQKKSMSQERRSKKGVAVTTRNEETRNLMNGWSFVRSDMNLMSPDGSPRADLVNMPISAAIALGLDFAAVDLLMNSSTGEMVVVEVNTAPGMTTKTTTHFRYIQAICEYAKIPFSVEIYNNRYGCDYQDVHLENLNSFLTQFN